MSLKEFQLFDNTHYDYLSQVEENASFTWNGDNSSVASVIGYYTGSTSVIQDFNIDKVQWYTFTMTTRVYLVDNEGNHSGYYTESYDFLSGQTKNDSSTLLQNNNPYSSGSYSDNLSVDDVNNNNSEPSVGTNDIPMSNGNSSSGNSSASAVTGDNNIVINNNPTFNNSNDSSSSGGGGGGSSTNQSALNFYNTFNPFYLIFNKLNNNNSVLSDDTVESIGANKFIVFMSNTFTFIPDEMWSILTLFLGASLSILIVAVVLRIILDLL